jgi:hypothetical protein
VNPSEMQPAQQYRADGLALVKSCGVDVPVRGPFHRVLVHPWHLLRSQTKWQPAQLKKCHRLQQRIVISVLEAVRSVRAALFPARNLWPSDLWSETDSDQHKTNVTTNRHSVPAH